MNDIIKEAVRLTCKFVSIPSESSNPVSGVNRTPEAGIAAELALICTTHNIAWKLQEVLPDRHNFIAYFPKAGAPKILFLIHMDTVSGKGMTNPFGGELRDDKIWGRGSCDDKGSLATIFAVLIGLRRQGISPQYDVTVVATVDEECGMAGAAKFAKVFPGSWDLCVAMEPSLLQPISAHIGVYRCRILLNPTTAKSSNRVNGASVLNIMADIKSDLKVLEKKICSQHDPRFGTAVMTVTEFGVGEGSDENNGPCRLLLDIRFLPRQNPWIPVS